MECITVQGTYSTQYGDTAWNNLSSVNFQAVELLPDLNFVWLLSIALANLLG